MSSHYAEQIATAIRATTIHSPTTYSWYGQLSRRLSPSVIRSITPTSARKYLFFTLQLQLYEDFYSRGMAVPRVESPLNPASSGMTPFIGELSEANAGQGYWESGWEVCRITDTTLVASKGGLELWSPLDHCHLVTGAAIEPGMRVRLRFPREYLGLSPGFYMATGENELPWDEKEGLLRFYWNLASHGAVQLVREVTLALNTAKLAFRLKVINDPRRYTRCDAGVLYIAKTDYPAVARLLEEMYLQIAPHLFAGVPAFTKQLAPGLGFAEDPGQGDSFGLQRCRLLADGLIRAYEQRRTSLHDRLEIVQRRFLEAGIVTEQPFLNPGSADSYAFYPRREHPWRTLRGAANSAPVRPLDTEMDASSWLSTAADIGRGLAEDALWHGNQCNWMGSMPAELPMRKRHAGVPSTYMALGPDIYTGTAGVALFLAELYTATGCELARRTAVGALRCSLSRANEVPGSNHLGLYTGQIGIALVAASVGALLAEEELIAAAGQAVKRVMRADRSGAGVDLLSGRAGAIIALVSLQRILDNVSLLDFSGQLGDELIDHADITDEGYSWKSKEFPKQRNLTGFSHGTAGIGYALLLLSAITGESSYRIAAERAFDYERFWFVAKVGNWSDLRDVPRRRSRRRTASFVNYWCHGAAGIAVSRLRAFQLVDDEAYKAEAIIALKSTQRMVEASIHSETDNFSLCHGLSGNADVLLLGEQVLGNAWPDGIRIARAVGQAGIERTAKSGQIWQCGVANGTTPGLMLGLAGIGLFYLRLYNPVLSSILSLCPEFRPNRQWEPISFGMHDVTNGLF